MKTRCRVTRRRAAPAAAINGSQRWATRQQHGGPRVWEKCKSFKWLNVLVSFLTHFSQFPNTKPAFTRQKELLYSNYSQLLGFCFCHFRILEPLCLNTAWEWLREKWCASLSCALKAGRWEGRKTLQPDCGPASLLSIYDFILQLIPFATEEAAFFPSWYPILWQRWSGEGGLGGD